MSYQDVDGGAAGRDFGIRFGLCCQFVDQPVRFRTTTAKYLQSLPSSRAIEYLSEIVRANLEQLIAAYEACHRLGIRAFRINSGLLPLNTHPELAYRLDDLPDAAHLIDLLYEGRTLADRLGIRRSFHPDQFVVLNSPHDAVRQKSITELVAQADLARRTGADVVNLHGGGVYGDKEAALARLQDVILALPSEVRSVLTLENDDRSYTPRDLLPVCRKVGIPLVYDVHHHRCNPDGMSVREATERTEETWNREPLFHVSSPRDGWRGRDPRPHADFVDYRDFPVQWLSRQVTVDVEAKAKEQAVLRLADQIRHRFRRKVAAAA